MIHEKRDEKWRLWTHAALMAGREFCYSLEIVSVTPVMKTLGLPDQGTSWIWVASPIFGLLFGPFIGSFSDRCTSPLGRRRPFIITLCILAMVGMSLLTFAPHLASAFQLEDRVALGFAIVGSQLMDWGLDSTETPLRAYTLDCIQSSDDQTSAFNIQTLLTGLGGGFGYVMAGYFGIDKREELYYIALVFFLLSLIFTLTSYKEQQYRASLAQNEYISPSKSFESYKSSVRPSGGKKKVRLSQSKSVRFDQNMKQFQLGISECNVKKSGKSQSENQMTKYQKPISLARGFAMTTTRWTSDSAYRLTDSNSMPAGLDKDDWSDSDYDLTEDDDESDSSGSNRVDGFLALQGPLDKSDSDDRISATTSTPCLKNTIVVIDANNNEATDIISSVEQVTDPATNSEAKKAKRKKRKDKEEILVEPIITPKNILSSLRNIPIELGTLCLVDLCTWTTLCTFLIYYTDVMGEDVYQGDPSAPQNSTEFINYQTGFKMGCYGLVEYSIFMSLGSAIIEKFDLFEKIPIKNIYALSYGIVTLLCLAMYIFPQVEVILSLTWLIGMAISVLYTVPMLLLSKYHRSSVYKRKSLPGTKRSYGLDCAILVSQNYLGQLVMSIIVGPLISFSSSLIIFLISATFSFFGFILSICLVHYKVA